MKNIAAILAGGLGNRMKNELPKQFLELSGKAILCHSIDEFERNNKIDEILIVVPENFVNYTRNLISKYSYSKVECIIKGGKTRHLSSYEAIKYINQKNTNCKLLLHDAARPFISQKIIDDIIYNLDNYSAVCPYVPVSNTIYELNENNEIISIPDRKSLGNIQTPQGFRLKTIKAAFEKCMQNSRFNPTDDCSIVQKYLPSVTIKMISGDLKNKKITYTSDFQSFKP